MALQYHCQNEARRSRIVDWNLTPPYIAAIDYVEVVDSVDLVPYAAYGSIYEGAQRTLVLYGLCAWPIGLTRKSVTITGGSRVKSLEVTYLQHLNLFLLGGSAEMAAFTAPERYWIDALKAAPPIDAAWILVLRLDQAGDFSTYTLTIDWAGLPIPDPILKSIPLSFKVSCPSPLDCETDDTCEASSETTPTIDYLAKDYGSFRQLMLDRMAVVCPDWEERSPADLGVTLVELLAYVTDQLSYYQDAVATEAYLHTARRRVSVRRHARLLDYPMHDGCNARTWLVATVSGDVTLEPGARVLTRLGDYGTVIPEDELEAVLLRSPTFFEAMHAVSFTEARNALAIYTWLDVDCCLPKGATRATIQVTAAATPPAIGDVLVLEEVIGPDTGLAEDADRRRRQAVRLTAVEAATDPLDDSGMDLYDLTWHHDDALTFAARLGESGVNYVWRGNVVLVDHGYTEDADSLSPATVTEGRYRPKLSDTGVTFASAYDPAEAATTAAAATLTQDVTEALPGVTLTDDDGDDWGPQRDLLSSDAFAREFVVETEDDGSAWIRFGDGTSGAAPTVGHSFAVRWRKGTGIEGNIGAEALAHVVDAGSVTGTGLAANLTALRNPLPAIGGTDGEPIADVQRFAPDAFRVQKRAVTAADYETILLRRDDVQAAKARLRFTGSWRTMYVTVDRKGTSDVDQEFLDELAEHLENYRMMGVDLEMRAPQNVGLDILLTVCVDDDYERSEVLEALLTVFSAKDNDDGTRGYFHPDNFSFGDPVYLSQLIVKALEVDGVHEVFSFATGDLIREFGTADAAVRFRRWGAGDNGEILEGVIRAGVYEVLRVDNDPSDPENGVIRFNLLGGR